MNHPEYQFKSDIYMAYHDEHIEEYRLMRDDILGEITDAAGESSKIPRLQRALQEFDENFDVIGLINFNWDHTVGKPLSKQLLGRMTPDAKSTIIKNKYAVRYLAGQERCADCLAWHRISLRNCCSFASVTRTRTES